MYSFAQDIVVKSTALVLKVLEIDYLQNAYQISRVGIELEKVL